MMNASDWLRMQAEMAAVRTDRSIPVEFRRGAVTLAAQECRVEAVGRGSTDCCDRVRRYGSGCGCG
jgi:hypothetical protein